jgi:crotonobetainyl-CoA:carnitine CoA-transferase CaiB-like acyl-CoA transferase
MDRVDLVTDPRFATLTERAARSDEINGLVAQWTMTQTADATEAACIAHDVPVATAFTAADIFADAHVAARGDLVSVEDPVIGPVRQQAPFPRFIGAPPNVPTGAPLLGADTRAVLAELLKLDDDELDRLAADGIT